jgi:hypothetical protein
VETFSPQPPIVTQRSLGSMILSWTLKLRYLSELHLNFFCFVFNLGSSNPVVLTEQGPITHPERNIIICLSEAKAVDDHLLTK